jgi:SAM-dependent methyltransferase
LPDFDGLDFSGERVIPGLVDPNLFNEHLGRYRFAAHLAARFANSRIKVLDAGCGSGYGPAQFGPEVSVIGIDVAHDAVQHATETYGSPNVQFLQASCDTIPFADGSFDLVVAFEVIEHLERWQDLLSEARRVLKPSGVLLVSTPNKTYYAESRAEAGPNPYHVHEFEYEEFAAALTAVFPHAHLWSQNHTEAIAFVPTAPSPGYLDVTGDPSPLSAHFFLAACSVSPIAWTDPFAWLPETGNVLREREHHIALLEDEVRQKTEWLEQQTGQQAELKREHDSTLRELEQRNEWAGKLNADIAAARLVISRLEAENIANNQRSIEAITRLEQEARVRLDWIHGLEQQIANGNAEIQRRGEELEHEREVYERRSAWGEEKAREALHASQIVDSLNEQNAALQAQLANQRDTAERARQALEQTRWLRLGRKLGLVTGEHVP